MKSFRFAGAVSTNTDHTPQQVEQLLAQVVSAGLRDGPAHEAGLVVEFSLAAVSLLGKPKDDPVKSPHHLMYLLDIYRGAFDERVRAGLYAKELNFAQTIADLIRHDLIRYTGNHVVSPKGTEQILDFLMRD